MSTKVTRAQIMVDGLRARELQKLIDDYRGTFRVVIIL